MKLLKGQGSTKVLLSFLIFPFPVLVFRLRNIPSLACMFCFSKKRTPLFLITNMAAVTSRANQQFVVLANERCNHFPKQFHNAPRHNTDPVSGAASKLRFHEMLEAESMGNQSHLKVPPRPNQTNLQSLTNYFKAKVTTFTVEGLRKYQSAANLVNFFENLLTQFQCCKLKLILSWAPFAIEILRKMKR